MDDHGSSNTAGIDKLGLSLVCFVELVCQCTTGSMASAGLTEGEVMF